jgi:high affinity sulfate transporter 1
MSQEAEKLVRSRKIRWPRPWAGIRGIKPADLPREITAGITLAALIIPLNIGYAQLVGLPSVVGLYAGIIPLAVFAIFTPSRHVVSSPDASMAALLGAALLGITAPGDLLRVHYALAIALMCGLLLLVFWYFRLAFLSNFLSRPVLVGFFSGLGIEVFTNQARKILGVAVENVSEAGTIAYQIKESIPIETEGFFLELFALIKSIPYANLYTAGIGVATIVIIRLLKRYAPKLPGALVALVLMTSVVVVFNLDKQGVGVLGAVPAALPSLSLPRVPLVDWIRLMPSAMAVASITLCESLMVAHRYSRKYGYKADGNQVLFAFGMANVAAGFTGSFAMGNSPSRAAAMDSLGAKSQVPSLVAAGTVAIVLLYLSDALALLPNAALAGIVANAVISLIDVNELRLMYRMRRSDFWIAVVCLFSVLVLGPLRAIIVAFLLSTIEVVRRASQPHTSVLQETPDGSYLSPGEIGCNLTTPGLIVYRFEAPLYFANANLFEEQVEHLVTQASTPVRWFVLDAQAIVDIDTTGAEALKQVLNLLTNRNITFVLSRINAQVLSLLKHYELLGKSGESKLYATNRQAVAAFYQECGSPFPKEPSTEL